MRIETIGGIRPESPFFLAPMAGVTDSPFRRICRKMGAGLVYSEMLSSKGLYYDDKKTGRIFYLHDDEDATVFQIFGHEPEIMAYAARELDSMNNVILDINMGCPVPKIVKNNDGSAMMKSPSTVEAVVRAVVGASSKPVTVKIRSGFSSDSINAVEVALAAEEAGCSAVAVHGRTREQFYTGRADWDIIAEVKENLSIPVIGNGDVTDADSAMNLFRDTGCDFIMVGRASRGNPWIFKELNAAWKGEPLPEKVSKEELKDMMEAQFKDLVDVKGEYAAVREMRKVTGWYLRGMPGSAAARQRLNQITEVSRWYEELDYLFNL